MTQAASPPTTNIQTDIDTVNVIKGELRGSLVERDAEIDLIVLSLIARVHGLIIGAPGAAKSMTVREVTARVDGANYWETLFRKSMPVEQIIGPVSLQGLTQDIFKYITTGKLPEAHVAFGDEVFKSNAVVANALLTILNERIFHNNGGKAMTVPLWSFIGASNELPTEQELMAFRDRFAWCRITTQVKTDDGFKSILRGQVERNAGTGVTANPTVIDMDAILRLQAASRLIDVPDAVLSDLAQLRRKAEGEANLHISPRRYGEGVKLAQALALLAGRDHVITDDLVILKHTIWTDEEDIPKAEELALDFAGKSAKEAARLRQVVDPLYSDLLALRNEIAAAGGKVDGDVVPRLTSLAMEVKKTRDKVEAAITDAQSAQRSHDELSAVLGEVEQAYSVVKEIMG